MLSFYSEEIKIERRENEIWCICDDYIKVIIGIKTFSLTAKSIDGEPCENGINFKEWVCFYENEILKAIDFLRSRSYALPFHDLSVNDLISYGWVKLKTK